MNSFSQSFLKASLLLIAVMTISACGKKGNLIVEQPPVQQQVEEPEQTR